MTEAIDVSIIIPSYNSEPFLKRSVLSCLSQKGVTAEVIVVDDQGKDFTRDILETVQRGNPEARLQVIRRPGGLGQATARNEGLAAAKGRYVALLDSDDAFCSNSVLAEWVAAADAQALEMLISRFYNVSPAMVRNPARRIDLQEGEVYAVADAPQLVNVVSCWQILYSRAFLEQNGVIFSPRLKQREDRLFVIEALLKAARVGVTELFTVDHYNVENSSFKQIDAGQLEQYVQHLTELNEAFAAARGAGRSNLDFERANAIIYLRQLDEYWTPICRRLSSFERCRPLVERYYGELRKMVADLPLLYGDQVLDPGAKDAFLREGRMDLLRLALKRGDRDGLTALMRRPKPPISMLAELRGVDDTAEEAVTRAWSFRRTVPAGPSEVPLKAQIKRIILHTGLPKTGSSSLQQVLERNRFKLLQQGIHYPSFGTYREHGIRRERTPGHASLVQKILDGEAEEALRGLSAELQEVSEIAGRPVETLVLSSENIVSPRFWDHGRQFAGLLAAFDGIPVEVACVLRHPESWLSSLYVEMCGNPWNGFSRSLEEFTAELDGFGLFDFGTVAKVLQAPPQAQKLHLGIYEQIRAQGGIEGWFYRLAGIDGAGFAPVSRALSNHSMSPQQAALMRNLKRVQGLSRDDLTALWLAVQGDAEAAAGKAPTRQMAEGLARFRTTHAAQIGAYEQAHGQTGSQAGGRSAAEPGGLDLECALDRHLAAQQPRTGGPGQVKEFLARLDQICAQSNQERILRLCREDRGICLSVELQPGERAAGGRLIHAGGEERFQLLAWEDEALMLADPGRLAELWQAGIRDLEIEVPTNQRIGRRPFRIVRLLPDGSFWLLPPAFAEQLAQGGLDAYWQ
ncbi:glycosyltransferase family 2 protein [Leisingera sp. ANG-Vp]|uniref:glycosyltransferase family 2 protein n=1 Tax=Leisingera sp. ANG-Vp TaxID=1577896 RepID=UPI00069183C9|nr:glycosyltransferase family 2 protein [Leisingera sp. ANG-Vp]